MSGPPYFSSTSLRCAKCGYRWNDYIANTCSFAVAIASMREIAKRGCPSCGDRRRGTVLMVTSKETAP